MKTEERVTFRYGMILGPPPMDESWRRRKQRREAGQQLKGMIQGMALMLVVVIISYFLIPVKP